MPGEHPKWGPGFDEYVDTLDKRMGKAFSHYTASQETTSVAHDGLPPLSVLETMLAVGENMHKVKCQHGGKSLPVLMRTIREYLKITGVKIFDYYYGYLCMRHLMRTICIGTLLESNTLDGFLESFDSNDETVYVNVALEEEALEQMLEPLLEDDTSRITTCLGLTPGCWEAFPCVGCIGFDDIELLIMTLWDNRRQLIRLIKHGLLSGFPSLMFTLSEMTMLNGSKQDSTKKWMELEEIILRAFMIGTLDQRMLYYHLALGVHQKILDHHISEDIRRDVEDARTVVRAYVEMFHPTRICDMFLTPATLNLSATLFDFVAKRMYDKLEDCCPRVAWAGLERFWLEYDQEAGEPLAPNKQGLVRFHLSDVFHVIRQFKESIAGQQTHREFDKSMQKADILALIGRTLLLISRDSDEPECWSNFREFLKPSMHPVAYGWYPITGLSMRTYLGEWMKVQKHFLMLLHGIAPTEVPKQYIDEAMQMWALVAPLPVGDGHQRRPCSYPRCGTDLIVAQMPEAKYICGRCARALYCGNRCQQLHWVLPTSDSHKTLCKETEDLSSP